MKYNLNRVREIMEETHPKFGNIGFYLDRPFDVVEQLGYEDITIPHPKRFGINILGRPDVEIDDIVSFQNTMKYMGFVPYYWDFDKWGMLFFEFEVKDGDEFYYDITRRDEVL